MLYFSNFLNSPETLVFCSQENDLLLLIPCLTHQPVCMCAAVTDIQLIHLLLEVQSPATKITCNIWKVRRIQLCENLSLVPEKFLYKGFHLLCSCSSTASECGCISNTL